MRGLPAFRRAVPARLFGRPRTGHGAPIIRGGRLLGLVSCLPPELRALALTHSSQAATRVESNERLEFLGDSVLGLIIAAELFDRYPESEEGDLARLKSYVVSRANCAEVAEGLGIERLMATEAGEARHRHGQHAHGKAIAGNALEALIGACFLTYGLEGTRGAVAEVFESAMQRGVDSSLDSKTTLQELLARRGLQPQYKLASEDGPAHARIFCSDVIVDGSVRGTGTGTTIKMSEQAAAREALSSYGVKAEDG